MCIREQYTTFKTLKANVFIGYNNPHDFSKENCLLYIYRKGVTISTYNTKCINRMKINNMEKPLQNRLKGLDFRSAKSKHMFWFKSSKDKFQTLFAMKFSIQPSITIKLLTHPQRPLDFSLYGYCVRTDIYTHVYAFQTISCRFCSVLEKLIRSQRKEIHDESGSVEWFSIFIYLFLLHIFFFFLNEEQMVWKVM